MIGHHTRLGENDEFGANSGPAIKMKPPFFNARALITFSIIRRPWLFHVVVLKMTGKKRQ